MTKILKKSHRSRNFKRRARRNYRRKVRRNLKNKSIVSIGQGFPKKMVVTHKYNEIFQISSTTGLVGTYQFVANGMYDPNFTGTGHQPMYFDQLSALYDHYVVIGSKATFKITPATTLTCPIAVALFNNDDTTITPTLLSSMSELPSSRFGLLSVNTNRPLKITSKWSAKKTFGKNPLANDNLEGSASANPSEQTVYTLACQSTDGATTQAVVVEVIIEYIAVWKELKDIAGS